MRLRKRRVPEPLIFEAYGAAFRVTLDEASLQGIIEEILPPFRVPCEAGAATASFGLQASEHGGYTVTLDEAAIIERAELDVALGLLDAQIRMFVATNARGVIFVHAGAVAVGEKALVIPGESFCGKSTLVAALVRSGARYYSDEYAVLDADGRLHPYPRRLSIRGPAGPTEHSVTELGGVAGDQPAGVCTVVITRYRPGAKWRPRELSAGEGVLALLANTVPAQQRPRESMQALSRAVRGATILEGDRGEAVDVAPGLLEQLAGERAMAAPERR